MMTFTRRNFGAVLTSYLSISALQAGGQAVVRLGGTGAALGGLHLINQSYQKLEASSTVEVLPSLGSGGGIRALSEKAIDVAFSARPLKDKEAALGLAAQVYARTPLSLIANPSVPLDALSQRDLISIFDGQVTQWSDGSRIRIITRPPSESDVRLVREMSPDMARAIDEMQSRPGLLVAWNDQENADMVESTPGAIGVATLAQIRAESREVRILALDGIRPETHLAGDPDNRFVKTFSIVTREDVSKPARAFLDFLQSTAGQEILTASGHFPLTTLSAG